MSSWEEMEIICHDFSVHLRRYLNQIEKSFSAVAENKQKMNKYLIYPQLGLTAGNQRAISLFLDNDNIRNINVINFNYTHTFEKLCGYQGDALFIQDKCYLRTIRHIHMSLDSEDVVLGVNDESQIAHKEIICPELLDILVKPHINSQLGTLIDNECVDMVNHADLICLFGVSLGLSDNYWWERIGKKMKDSNCRLIYYAYDSDHPQFFNKLIGKRRYYMNLISDRCRMNMENESVRSRVFIGYKTDFFKF